MTQPDLYYSETFGVHIEFQQEADGRWIAEVRSHPGVLAYGTTCPEALAAVLKLLPLVIGARPKE